LPEQKKIDRAFQKAQPKRIFAFLQVVQKKEIKVCVQKVRFSVPRRLDEART